MFASTINDFIAKSIDTDRASLDAQYPARDLAAFEEAWNARAQGAVGEVHAFEPHYEGSAVVWDSAGRTSSAKGSHRFDARPGHHLAPAMLRSGRNVYEELGTGFTLLAFGASVQEVQAFRDAAAEHSLPLAVVQAQGAGEHERYDARLVLVRPDQFVAWVGHGAELGADQAREVLELAAGVQAEVATAFSSARP